MRGMFTAGVLDVFMENNIIFDDIIGVSAGALFGVNYLSNQKGRAIRYTKRFSKDLRYMSILSLIFTGNLINKNFAYYKVSKKLDPFDDKKFIENKSNFYATVTNLETGKPEYLKINSCFNDLEILRATSAIPVVSKPVTINNSKYLDGAMSDSIPVLKMKEMGCDKIVVILTRPLGYRKEAFDDKKLHKIRKKYKKFPRFINAMENRYKMYNETLDKILELEKNNEIFVIRPSNQINLKVLERNSDKLQEVYDLGIKDANNKIDKLKKYLYSK